MAGTTGLPDLLRHAGAVMTARDGHPVAAHYGSAAGELALCVSAVGLAVRTDLAALAVTGSERVVDRLAHRVLGQELAPSGAALESGAWWCRAAAGDELLVVGPRGLVGRIAGTLRHDAARIASDELAVLGVVGRKAMPVLAALGVVDGDPRLACPFAHAAVAGHPVSWLLQSDTAALAVVPAASAAEVWWAIDVAGRDHGIACVGLDAIERFALATRAARRSV